jgi:hypothetical protein
MQAGWSGIATAEGDKGHHSTDSRRREAPAASQPSSDERQAGRRGMQLVSTRCTSTSFANAAPLESNHRTVLLSGRAARRLERGLFGVPRGRFRQQTRTGRKPMGASSGVWRKRQARRRTRLWSKALRSAAGKGSRVGSATDRQRRTKHVERREGNGRGDAERLQSRGKLRRVLRSRGQPPTRPSRSRARTVRS